MDFNRVSSKLYSISNSYLQKLLSIFESTLTLILFSIFLRIDKSSSRLLYCDLKSLIERGQDIDYVEYLVRLSIEKVTDTENLVDFLGFCAFHVRNCSEDTCSLKMYLSVNKGIKLTKEGVPSLRDVFKKFILSEYTELMKLRPNSTEVKISLCYFLFYVLENKEQCLTMMMRIRESPLSIRDKYLLFHLQNEVTGMLTISNINEGDEAKTSNRKSMRLMIKKAKAEFKLRNQIEQTAIEFNELWRSVSSDNSHLNILISCLRKINSNITKLERIEKQNYAGLVDSEQMLTLNGFFNLLILNKQHIGRKMIQKAKDIFHRKSLKDANNHFHNELIGFRNSQLPNIIAEIGVNSFPIVYYNNAVKASLRIYKELLNLYDIIPEVLRELFVTELTGIRNKNEKFLRMFFKGSKGYIKEMTCIIKVAHLYYIQRGLDIRRRNLFQSL